MSRQSSPSTHPGFSGDSLSKAWVLGSNGTLWYELGPWGNVPPPRQQVGAGSVLAFSPIGQTGQALVLGRDGRLWLNTVGQSAGPEIDGNVAAFDGNVTLGQQLAYVLGKDGSLWLERGPWGTVPPSRQIVDRNVQAFQTVNANQVYVLGDDGNLWLESALGASCHRPGRKSAAAISSPSKRSPPSPAAVCSCSTRVGTST